MREKVYLRYDPTWLTPALRERPMFYVLDFEQLGFTPACAGKTGKKSHQIKVLIFEMFQ